jgi:hypothetical protein
MRTERQEDHRYELHEADEAEIERAARQLIELPADGHALHVEGERGQHARRKQERERPMAEDRGHSRLLSRAAL